MDNKLVKGFIAGALGAVVLTVVMYILKAAGMGDPAFVGMYRSLFDANPPADQIIAAVLFIISGGIWGVVYALLVKHPTVMNGFFFGILPTLWLWVVINAVIGKPLFNDFTLKGILMPIIFNMVIWGTITGWYMASKREVARY